MNNLDMIREGVHVRDSLQWNDCCKVQKDFQTGSNFLFSAV